MLFRHLAGLLLLVSIQLSVCKHSNIAGVILAWQDGNEAFF